MQYLCKQAKTVFGEVHTRQLVNYSRFFSTARVDKTTNETMTENDFHLV